MSNGRPLEEQVEVASNPEPRCPCVLLLDTSSSMKGERLEALSKGLDTLRADLSRDTLTARRVEVAVVTFDSEVRLVQRFVTADRFVPPALRASGQTCMAAGIDRALAVIESRKQQYRRHGLSYFRPWVFMITDGKPEGEPDTRVAEVAARLRVEEQAKRVAFFAVGVGDADMNRLSQITVRRPLELEGLQFDELFLWLSASMQCMSRSQPGQGVVLPRMGWLKKISQFVRDHEGSITDVISIGRVAIKLTTGL
jgi:uncharacterized protein YegL